MEETPQQHTGSWPIAVGAMLIALAPHAFFPTPFELHMAGEFPRFYGMAIWPAAFLAGVAFFFGTGPARPAPTSADRAAIAMVVATLGIAVAFAIGFEPFWTQMGSLRPTDELMRVTPLYMGLGALAAVFWQGYVQSYLLRSAAVPVAVLACTVLPVVIVLPFFFHGDPSVVARVAAGTVGASLLPALAHGLGFGLRGAVLAALPAWFMFVWFQQAVWL